MAKIKQQLTDEEKKVLKKILEQKPKYDDIAIHELNIDLSYQRRPREKMIKQIMGQFSPVLCMTIQVSRRPNGTLWVVNGATRIMALKQMGNLDYKVHCEIFNTEGAKQEALLFVHFDIHHVKVPLATKLEAAGVAGVNEISRILASGGFNLGESNKNSMKGVSYIPDAYTFDGGESLQKAVFSFASTSFLNGERPEGITFKGVAWLYFRYRPKPIDNEVRWFLNNQTQEDLNRLVLKLWSGGGKIKARLHPGDVPKLIAKAIVLKINARRTKKSVKLDPSRLDD